MTNTPVAAAVIRGEVIDDGLVEFGGRGGELRFLGPAPSSYVDRLPLQHPGLLRDLHRISFDDILDYLEELGRKLDPGHNAHMQQAKELSYLTAPTAPSLIDTAYADLVAMFGRDSVRQRAERRIGIAYLDGWVENASFDGARVAVRAFGSRSLHIVAGNSPVLSALTIIRGAITRSDCIVKAPSNDPFTAIAIARTMVDMAPDHPITRHLSVAYWRGGDEDIERRLYSPKHIEKIVAWGGFASIAHVTKYLQPGLELVTLDPKRSASIVGPGALDEGAQLEEAAVRIAVDVGAMNQEACASARVVYVITDGRDDTLDQLNRLGQLVYEQLVALPESMSTSAIRYDSELRSHVEPLRADGEWFRVIGGESGEGCVIVSQLGDPVPFADLLSGRTVNIVPVDGLDDVLLAVDEYTQTIGVFPDDYMAEVRDVLPLYGAQRLVSLGYALFGCAGGPQDAIEPERRMCKWIVNEMAPRAEVPSGLLDPQFGRRLTRDAVLSQPVAVTSG